MKKTELQMVLKKIDGINEKIEQFVEGNLSDLDYTIIKLRELIERCKRIDADTCDDFQRLLAAQVYLERALGELVSIHSIVENS